MKAYEVPMKVMAEGRLQMPSDLAETLRPGQTVRVIVLVSEPEDEDEAWSRFAMEQFFAGYDDVDAIYDKLK